MKSESKKDEEIWRRHLYDYRTKLTEGKKEEIEEAYKFNQIYDNIKVNDYKTARFINEDRSEDNENVMSHEEKRK